MPIQPTDWDPPHSPPQTDAEAAAASAAAIGGASDWDPPRRASNRHGLSGPHLLSSALAARATVGAHHEPRPSAWPAQVPDLSIEDRLRLWDLRVRMQLAMAELMAGVQHVATVDAAGIASEVRIDAAGGGTLLSVTRPSADRLLDTGVFAGQALGLAGVDAAQAVRPGRVDAILAADQDLDLYFMEALALPVARYPFTYTLLRVALAFSSQLTQTMKHAFGIARPHQLWTGVLPMLEVPRHGSFPGGHAAQSAASALLLGELADSLGARVGLSRLAKEVAQDRVVAGLHYPIDSDGGEAVGELAARVLIAAEQPAGQVAARLFDSNRMPGPVLPGPAVTVRISGGVVQALWALARQEWQAPQP